MHATRALLTCCLLAGSVSAVERFPFAIPGDDATASATNLSKLSPRPAGAGGFVTVRDGKFFTKSGRLKIWGVNTCFGGNFPSHDEAEKAAAHLAKLGVNGLRMHHHDGRDAPRGIWARKLVGGKRVFDPQMLDRQDYFLDQLHKNGIYANLNLHVSRTFTEAEGFLGKGLPRAVRYDKYLLYYEPRMRKLFKDFCRVYLTHRNPYRKLRRVDDPGIALLEITNENAFSTRGPGIAASLPEPYRGEFKRQWNAWLKAQYATTAALRKAWKENKEPLGGDLADMGDLATELGPWRLRQDKRGPVEARFGQPGPTPELKAMKLDIITPVRETFRQELMRTGLSVEKGKLYTLSFWIRADKPRSLYLDVSNSGPGNWRSVGFRETLSPGPKWQRIERVFRATETIRENARVCLKFGGSPVDLALADVRLRRGGTLVVLPEGQTIERGNVELPLAGWVEEARRDVRQFMADTEKGFIREIIAYLKDDLGVRVPVTASQITYHGAEIVAETCDYADIHAYWQHPRFPGRPWDPNNWSIGNSPMARVPGRDALLRRCPWRLLDRPFTLSEWNIPDPSDFGASVVPFAAMAACLQDWDGIFFFQYHSSEKDWFGDRIRSYFSFNGQPVKLALFTACANLYRRGDLEPLPEAAAGTLADQLPATLALSRRIGIDPKAAKPSPAKAPKGRRLASPDGRVVWDATDPAKAHVAINTPATRAVWGLVAGQDFQLGSLKVSVGETFRDYAAIVLTSLDGQPLERSKRMLLTAVGSAQNRNMVWNETRTTVGRNWGTGPTQVNGIPATLSLRARIQTIRALDARGLPRKAPLALEREGNVATWTIGPEHRTLWYEIVSE